MTYEERSYSTRRTNIGELVDFDIWHVRIRHQWYLSKIFTLVAEFLHTNRDSNETTGLVDRSYERNSWELGLNASF